LAFVLLNDERGPGRKVTGVTNIHGQINSHRTEGRTIVPEKTPTFEENVSAQLEKSKSQIKEIEGLAKGIASQAETDAINALKNKRQEIEKKYQELKTSASTKAKAAIETDLAKFNDSLGQVATKLKNLAASKPPAQQK
jgi:NADH dehydrogenase/NADH:ubiquinone oxidoreductase subunit G